MYFDDTDFKALTLPQIRECWAQAWGMRPHRHIGRKMMERSLMYKTREQNGHGLTPDQKHRLNKLISTYKRNPDCFDQGHASLKPGMRLIRNWKGKAHVVTVTARGFIYQDKDYSSLSNIASKISGSRWNGWVFFRLKENRK